MAASSAAKDADDQAKDHNKVRAKATGDLDKVTDYVEEREIDATKVADSMRAMLGSAPTSAAARAKGDKTSGIKISPHHVQLIVDELDVDHRQADLALRRASGDVVNALCQLLH